MTWRNPLRGALPATILILACLGLLFLGGAVWFDWIHPKAIVAELRSHPPWQNRSVPWELGDLGALGFDKGKMDALRDDLSKRQTKAFLVARHNRIAYEWYASDFGANKRHFTASVAKSLVGGMALILALNDGRMELDDPAWLYIPVWKEHPVKSRITIRHLVTHTSGLSGTSSDDTNGWKGVFWRERSQRIRTAITEAPIVGSPGQHFEYSTPGFEALSYAISASIRNTADPDLKSLLHQRVMSPIGVPLGAYSISYGESYECDGLNLYVIGGGGEFTARAAARMGQLMLNGGRWADRQLISSNLVGLATSNAAIPAGQITEDHPAPGLGWWCNTDGVWDDVPRDAFVGAGNHDQFLIVIPSLNLVSVRLGRSLTEAEATPEPVSWGNLETFVLEPLMDAVVR